MNTVSHPGMIQFQGYRLTDIAYRCDDSFEFPKEQPIAYGFNFQKGLTMPTEHAMRVKLRANVFWPHYGNTENAPFCISVEIAGLFTSEDTIHPKWEVNALAILFPYIRSLISSISSQSGREPILLPTVNIAEIFGQAVKKKSDFNKELNNGLQKDD